MADANLVYAPDEKPRSAFDWGLYSVQWIVTMFYAVVWGFALVGIALDFEPAALASYMSAIALVIGLGTLTQAAWGHRFAMVSGPNVIPSLAILAALGSGGRAYALEALTAQAITGVLVAVLGIVGVLGQIRKVWSPLVLGSMVLMVGLSVASVGLEQLTADGFGWPFWVGTGLALGGSVLAIRGEGVWATLSPLFIIGGGYVIFIAAGNINWAIIREAPLLAVPTLFPYGLSVPGWELLLIMFVVNLMAAINMFGNIHGYAKVVDTELPRGRERRSFAIFGAVETGVAGVFGVPATVAYGENLGIVAMTRVAARAFILVAAVGFIVLGFVGPFGAFLAEMPRPIAGAVLLGIASTVIGIGAKMMQEARTFGRREQALVGFSSFLALGLYLLPEATWVAAPRLVQTVFQNPIISVILFVILFERVLFRHAVEKQNGED